MITIEVGIDQEKGHSQGFTVAIELGVQVVVDLGQDPEPVPIGIRCYNCREYDHFARDCPTSREERDLEQFQQMLNLEEEEQIHLFSSRQSSPIDMRNKIW